MVAVAPDLIILATEEELDTDHIFYGTMWELKFTIYGRVISSSAIYHNIIFKADIHAFIGLRKLSISKKPEKCNIVSHDGGPV